MSENYSIVVIPTYNEFDNISDIIDEIFSLNNNFHVLVVDDNSPDKTYKIVEEKIVEHIERLFLIKRDQKSGLGSAFMTAFDWVINSSNNYNRIYTMDADFSHNPKDLLRMKVFLDKNGMDLVIGSRYITGVNVVNWPIQRVLLSYFGSMYARIITGVSIMDLTSGYVGYKTKVIKDILSKGIEFNGYAYQIEMKYKAHLLGYKFYEIPIIFTDRTKGDSKMNFSIVPEAIFGLIKIRFKFLFSKL